MNMPWKQSLPDHADNRVTHIRATTLKVSLSSSDNELDDNENFNDDNNNEYKTGSNDDDNVDVDVTYLDTSGVFLSIVRSRSRCREIHDRLRRPHFFFRFILFFLANDTNGHTCFLTGLHLLCDAQFEAVLVQRVGPPPHFRCADTQHCPTTRYSPGAE